MPTEAHFHLRVKSKADNCEVKIKYDLKKTSHWEEHFKITIKSQLKLKSQLSEIKYNSEIKTQCKIVKSQ